jgi:hypothetical protein
MVDELERTGMLSGQCTLEGHLLDLWEAPRAGGTIHPRTVPVRSCGWLQNGDLRPCMVRADGYREELSQGGFGILK